MSTYYYLDMELCDFNLETHIIKWKELKLSSAPQKQHRFIEIKKIMSDISEGIVFIHQKREIHRDLKPQNGKQRFYGKTNFESSILQNAMLGKSQISV